MNSILYLRPFKYRRFWLNVPIAVNVLPLLRKKSALQTGGMQQLILRGKFSYNFSCHPSLYYYNQWLELTNRQATWDGKKKDEPARYSVFLYIHPFLLSGLKS